MPEADKSDDFERFHPVQDCRRVHKKPLIPCIDGRATSIMLKLSVGRPMTGTLVIKNVC
jgi:hypothetical protein